MITILDRHPPLLHRTLKNIYIYFSELKRPVSCFNIFSLKELAQFFKVYNSSTFIIPDPIVGVILFLLNPRACKRTLFFSFEMFEFQLPNNSLKNIIRNYLFKLLHLITLYLSSKIIFSNELRRNFYVKKYAWLKSKSYIFENYFLQQSNLEKPVTKHIVQQLKSIKKKYKTLILYAGGLQYGRSIEPMIQALQKTSANVCLLLAGPDRMGIEEYIKDKKHVYYLGQLSFEDTCYLYKNVNWGLMDYSNDLLNTKYCAPIKLYEYLAYNIGIICNKNDAMLKKHTLIDYYYNGESDLVRILKEMKGKKPRKKNSKLFEFRYKFRELLKKLNISIP